MSCGKGLERRCPSCDAEVPAGAKFCIECGAGMDTGPAAPESPKPAATAPTEPPPEERRQVSVLFADLSGYTAVAERTDPEAVKAMLDRALQRLGDQVERFGGSIDKYIGDNVMAVFGAPVAHEDDPERAVRAALAMQAEMDRINEQLPADVAFLLRVGINTGEVLAGRMGEGYTVIGDTVNVAARLQAAARPGSVTVGETTHRASRDSIAYDELEPLDAEGEGGAGPRLGGASGAGRAREPAGGAAGRRAPDRPQRRAEDAALPRRAARARGTAASGDHDRPGRCRQVSAAAGADRARRRAGTGAGGRGRRVPAVRLGDLLLGAGGGASVAVRDRRRRARRLRLGKAPRTASGVCSATRSAGRRRSGSSPRSESSSGSRRPRPRPRRRTRSGCARPCSPRSAP